MDDFSRKTKSSETEEQVTIQNGLKKEVRGKKSEGRRTNLDGDARPHPTGIYAAPDRSCGGRSHPLLFSVAAKYQEERFSASLQHLPSNF